MSKNNQYPSVDGENVSKMHEGGVKSKKRKKRSKIQLSFRIIIIAMILALLFLLNWDGLHFGGKIGELMGESQQEESSSSDKDSAESDSTTNSTSNSTADTEIQENVNTYDVIIREDKIIVFDQGKEVEVDQAELTEQLKILTNETVVLQDDGALNKVYEEVKEIITKALGVNTKLLFIEK